MEAFGFEPHDHTRCIRSSVIAAEKHCRSEGLQMTPVRRRVLEILLEKHQAMGAYEVLDILRSEGHAAQPPVAYRALDFLVKAGFAHRVERLNAFIACARPGKSHSPAFLICRRCERVAEAAAEPTQGRLGKAARESGFEIERAAVEAVGLCPDCRAGAAA